MEKISVLIADDSISIRTYLSSLLIEWGYEVTTCSDGTEALRIIQCGKYFPVLILDWIMPGHNGPDLCRIIRAQPTKKYQYIMLLTGKNSTDDLIEGLNAGADDYLIKPFVQAELKVRLDTAIRFYTYEQELKNKDYEVRIQVYHALTELAEKRDTDTGMHLDRISDLAWRLGQALELSEEMLNQLRIFAPMHDIGKVGISDTILQLPGKLSPEQFDIMKTHAEIGWEILKEKPTLEMAAEIAYCHHEKWDGSGYPRKLKGSEIPFSARIVSIVDVYDALRSKRPYKKPFTHEESMKIITESSGLSFDPTVTAVFCTIEKEMETIFDLLFTRQD